METKDLSWWREIIDSVDQQIIELLAKRLHVSEEIARVKKSIHHGILDSGREKEVIRARQRMAEEMGLDKIFVNSLFLLLMDYSKDIQKKVLLQN